MPPHATHIIISSTHLMILKPTILALSASLLLSSCGQDWQISRAPLPGSEQEEATEEPETEPAPRIRRSRPKPTPTPLKDNPFAVPDVSHDLPNEDDLKPGNPTTGTPAPVDPNPADPTVTTSPPAPAE